MRHHYKEERDDYTRAVLAMCENIDWNVGRLLQQLDDLGLTENTIVVYFSDNGPNFYRWIDGLRDRKASTNEGGTRVPMFMRWPGHIPAGKSIPKFPRSSTFCPHWLIWQGSLPVSPIPWTGSVLLRFYRRSGQLGRTNHHQCMEG